jgi:hypothetical protein
MFVHRLTPGSLGLSRLAQQMIHRTFGEQGVFLVGTATVATASRMQRRENSIGLSSCFNLSTWQQSF